MFLKAKFRKILVAAAVLTVVLLALTLVVVPTPDLSAEADLPLRIADLGLRVRSVQETNAARHYDLRSLWTQFAAITRRLVAKSPEGSSDDIMLAKELRLTNEGRALLAGTSGNWSYDLALPSIVDVLPHLGHSASDLQPAYKLSQGRGHVSITLGIPTVKRHSQSYLEQTLKSIFDNMTPEEADDTLVVLMVAEPYDKEHVKKVAEQVGASFSKELASGVLEVIAPPAEFYPDLNNLRQTLGDPAYRVQWRSKQNLDFAYLMMYCKQRSTFYVQLEDDLLTKPKFVKAMKDTALEYTASKQDWFMIDFCQLGFIGKLFKASSLPILVQFFLSFYNVKPVDWLLYDVINVMACAPSITGPKCKEERDKMHIKYKPSLFQHIGTHSSLRGKVQSLKDKQFGKVSLFTPHKNPPAAIETNIRHYKRFSISRAYRGEGFYWGLVPQANDFITITLTPPVALSAIKFVSGNVEHPHDKFIATDIEAIFDHPENLGNVPASSDGGFVRVASFGDNGVAEASNLDSSLGKAHAVRLKIRATSSENWVILSEIMLAVAVPQKVAAAASSSSATGVGGEGGDNNVPPAGNAAGVAAGFQNL